GDAVHRDRLELILDPGLGRGIVDVEFGRSVGGDGHGSVEQAAIDVARNMGREAGEALPLRAGSDGLLKQRDGLGIGAAALQRPVERDGREVADFLILLATELTGLLRHQPRVYRITSGGWRFP